MAFVRAARGCLMLLFVSVVWLVAPSDDCDLDEQYLAAGFAVTKTMAGGLEADAHSSCIADPDTQCARSGDSGRIGDHPISERIDGSANRVKRLWIGHQPNSAARLSVLVAGLNELDPKPAPHNLNTRTNALRPTRRLAISSFDQERVPAINRCVPRVQARVAGIKHKHTKQVRSLIGIRGDALVTHQTGFFTPNPLRVLR